MVKEFSIAFVFFLMILSSCDKNEEPEIMEPDPCFIEGLEFVNGVACINDQATYDTLSYIEGVHVEPFGDIWVRVQIERVDSIYPQFYFVNSKTHTWHSEFMPAVGIEPGAPGQMRGILVYREDLVAPNGVQGLYLFNFSFPVANFPYEKIAKAYELLISRMPLLDERLVYFPTKTTQVELYNEEIELYNEAPFLTYFIDDIGG